MTLYAATPGRWRTDETSTDDRVARLRATPGTNEFEFLD